MKSGSRGACLFMVRSAMSEAYVSLSPPSTLQALGSEERMIIRV